MSRETPTHDAIHSHFGLSYANYLVLNRSILQSMPDEWQTKFVSLLEELADEFDYLPHVPYNVQVLKRDPELINTGDICPDCDGCEYELDEDGFETENICSTCDGDGSLEGEDRYETPEEVGISRDPIPHYQRGRTTLPRLSQTREEVEGMLPYIKMYWEWFDYRFPDEARAMRGTDDVISE